MFPTWIFILLFNITTLISTGDLDVTIITAQIAPHEHSVISFSPDGRYIARYPSGAIMEEINSLEIWDSSTGEKVYQAGRIQNFHWIDHPDEFFVAFYDDPEGIIYNLEQNAVTIVITGMFSEWNVSPSWIITYEDGATWIRHTERLTDPLIFTNTFNRLVFSSTGAYLAMLDHNQISIYTTDTGELVNQISGEYQNIVFNPDDTAFLAQARQSYHLYTMSFTSDLQLETEFQGCGIPAIPEWFIENPYILLGGILWDYNTNTQIRLGSKADLSPDQQWIAALDTGNLYLYDTNTLEVIYVFENADTHISWSPNSRWLITYGYAGYAHLYDIQTGSFISELPHYHDFGACGIHLFPPQWNFDGSQLATYIFSTVRQWRERDRGMIHLPPQMDGLPFYTQPHASDPSGYLEEGTPFTIGRIDPTGWYAFETADGQTGWFNGTDGLIPIPSSPGNTIWLWALPN